MEEKGTRRKGIRMRSVFALILAFVMLLTAIPAEALIILRPEDNGERKYSDDVVAIMQEVVGDRYDAEDVLDALYEIGAVDETGMPIMTDSFVVDGKTVNAEELREMAYDHLTDEEDTTVVVDGTTITWDQLRSLFAIRDMNEALREAQEKGIAMNDDAHIELSKKLMEWLSGGGSGSGEIWHKVVRVGHYNAFYINTSKMPSYWCVYTGEDPLATEYDVGKGRLKEGGNYIEGLYYYQETRDSYNNVISRGSPAANINYVMTSRYISDYPDRLWFPSIASDGKFFYEDPTWGVRETTLERTSYINETYSRLKYDNRYEYLAEVNFQLNLRDILSASGYDAEQVRITLHAASAEDLLNCGGKAELSYSGSTSPIASVALTEANCTAMLDGGLELGVVDMAEYDDVDALEFCLRASDSARTGSDVRSENQGRVRPAGMYFTFEVIGDSIAPAANRFNNRLWLVSVEGKEDVYTLNTEYHGFLYGGDRNYGSGYRVSDTSEITLDTDIICTAANGDLYIDLVDYPHYILSSVLRNNTNAEQTPLKVTDYQAFSEAAAYGRLYLDRISTKDGLRYKVNVGMIDGNDLWKYGFDGDTIIDIPDSEIINTLTYSFIDYKNHIQSYDIYVSHMMDVGKLTVGSGSAKQEYKFRMNSAKNPVPFVMWDSVNRNLTVFEGYQEANETAGSRQINYSGGNDRAVLVQSRFLNYMNALGHEAYANSSVSYSNLTATPWVISQYGVYNYDKGNTYQHYDLSFTEDTTDPKNLQVIAPAMLYYPGDVIPIIVRNPNGVFDTLPGSDAAACTEWVKDNYTLTVNKKTLTPAEVSVRKDTNGGYGIDMLVFLFEVGSLEGGRLDFGIGNVTISNDGTTQYNLFSGMGEDAQGNDYLATIMTPDLGDILDVNSYTVVTENGKAYVEIPFRSDFSDKEMGEIIQAVTSWTTTPTEEHPEQIFKNAFAVPTPTGHPRGDLNSQERFLRMNAFRSTLFGREKHIRASALLFLLRGRMEACFPSCGSIRDLPFHPIPPYMKDTMSV